MLVGLKNFIKRHQILFDTVFFIRNIKEEIYSFLPWESGAKFAGSQRPLHGDESWQELVKKISAALPITSIAETGTYKGITTEFFAQNFSGPIFTCELMGLYFRESRQRLKKYANIKMFRKSSPDMLRSLAENNSYGALPLFFLDAHWYDYWPIIDEMKIIKPLASAIVMIDDFEVVGRPELGFDLQEKDGTVIKNNVELISESLDPKKDRVFFPTYGKDIRGYVLIFHGAERELARLRQEPFFNANYKEHIPHP